MTLISVDTFYFYFLIRFQSFSFYLGKEVKWALQISVASFLQYPRSSGLRETTSLILPLLRSSVVCLMGNRIYGDCTEPADSTVRVPQRPSSTHSTRDAWSNLRATTALQRLEGKKPNRKKAAVRDRKKQGKQKEKQEKVTHHTINTSSGNISPHTAAALNNRNPSTSSCSTHFNH